MNEDLNKKLEQLLIKYNEVVGTDDVGEDNIQDNIENLIEKLETCIEMKVSYSTLYGDK